MPVRALKLLALAFLFIFVAPVAFAQQVPRCGPYPLMVQAIAKVFGEVPAMTGIVGDGQRRMIMFVDPTDTSWTFGELTAEGMFCVNSSGSALDTEPQPKPGKPL